MGSTPGRGSRLNTEFPVPSPILRQVADRACYIAQWGRGGYSVFYLTTKLNGELVAFPLSAVYCVGFIAPCAFFFFSITNPRNDFCTKKNLFARLKYLSFF